MWNTDQIITFVQVVDQGSFSQAAKELGLSKAAVSRKITQLENALGTQLLERTTRKLSMTDAGQMLYAHAQRVSNELKELESVVSSFGEEATGLLKVHCGRHFGERFILPNLKNFVNLYPRVILSLELAERIPDWDRENFDVIVGYCLTPPETFIQRRVGECTFRLAASPGYLKDHGTPKKPEDLTHHTYISHLQRRPNNVVTFGDGKQITLVPKIYLSEVSAMKTSALQDMGMIWVHDYAVEKEIKEGKLIPLLTHLEQAKAPVFLYYPERRIQPPKVQAFVKFLLETVK